MPGTPFLDQWFQNPNFLWILAAVAIPPIIEWLLRRRRRIIRFAAMRYLLDPERQKKIKLQDRILLFLRMFIIFLVVLALSRPSVRPEDVFVMSKEDRYVAMLFDSTYSNAQRLGNQSAFETAKRMAKDALRGLPQGVKVTIAAMGHTLKEVQPWTDDKAILEERVESLKISHGAGGMADGLAWALKCVDEYKGKTEVYIFSDLQQATWKKGEGEGKAGAKTMMAKLSERAKVSVFHARGENTQNLYVTRFEPVDKALAVGFNTEFVVEIKTAGLKEGATMNAQISFFVTENQEEVKRDYKVLQVPAAGMTHKFSYTFLSPGERLLRVALEGDDSPLDNERLYLADVPLAMKVLILDDKGASTSPYLRPSVFQEFAISPPQPRGTELATAFTAKVADWGEAQKENFADYGAVILANVRDLPDGLVSRLDFYVREGGALWTIAGDAFDPFQYESKLYKGGVGLLPALPGDKTETANTLKPSLAHFGSLADGPVTHYRPLSAAGDVAANKTMLSLGDGKPVAIRRAYFQGRSMVTTVAPELSWGRLPLSIDFPVYVQETLRDMLGDPNRLVNLNVGQTYSQSVLISAQHLLLKTPDRRKIRLTPEPVKDEDLPRISFNDTDVQGLYELEAPPGVVARRHFAVNLNPEESDMTMFGTDEFSTEYGKGVSFYSHKDNISDMINKKHSLREFAGMMLILVFLFMLTESFLAMRFGLRKV